VTRLLRVAGRERGFTLIELMVVMVVLGILGASFAVVMASTVTQSSSSQDAAILQHEARAAVERFASDLRQAYTGDEATYPIEAVSATSIQFLSPDRAEPFHLRRITYRVVGGRLERSQAVSTDTDGPPWQLSGSSPWERLVDRITTASPFSFFDAGDLQTSNRLLVRTVRLELTIKTGGKRTATYGTRVTLRSDS
jgi:prepilin-type N-terminal cleavage/methylation domain-containing protein